MSQAGAIQREHNEDSRVIRKSSREGKPSARGTLGEGGGERAKTLVSVDFEVDTWYLCYNGLQASMGFAMLIGATVPICPSWLR